MTMTLEKAIANLCLYYEKAKTLEYVREPVAWAAYQTWRAADRETEKYKMKESMFEAWGEQHDQL